MVSIDAGILQADIPKEDTGSEEAQVLSPAPTKEPSTASGEDAPLEVPVEAAQDLKKAFPKALNAPWEAPPPPEDPSLGDLFGLLLRGDKTLHQLLLRESTLLQSMQHMLVIAIVGLGSYGLVLGWLAQSASIIPTGVPALWMPVVLLATMLGPMALCLPACFFFAQYFGLAISLPFLTTQAIRLQAKIGVVLLGLMPFYLAFVLASTQFWKLTGTQLDIAFAVGLLLPFGVGAIGFDGIYISFQRLMNEGTAKHNIRRQGVLNRIIFVWGILYCASAPIALMRLLQ